ncbi:hypothetical protein VM1G_10038 [Cytospora mali]|uniref:Uncharacterized protein n=1 Tax=Cytospora mali TaxID=578113 RepID=A0A194WDJ4_CYTMA|nr:hypothetical protein VM1G_10038 [Valsa mali]
MRLGRTCGTVPTHQQLLLSYPTYYHNYHRIEFSRSMCYRLMISSEMGFQLRRYVFATALAWLLTRPASGSSLTSWWLNYDPDLAPAIAKYDNVTGKIYYSLCNSIKTPVFALNDSTALDLDARYPPLSGTSIAGVGYAYGSGDDNPDVVQSPFFYLTDLEGIGPTIVEALFTCNRTTGHWYPAYTGGVSSWPLSNGTFTTDDRHIPIPNIDPETGLAALYIGTSGGHRIYFKSTNGTTHYIKYKSLPGPEHGWNYGGMISSNYSLLPSKEIAAAFTSDESDPDPDSLQIRVAYGVPGNASADEDVSGEIEWAESGVGGQEAVWDINRMPTTLLAIPRGDTNATVVLNNMTSSDYIVSFDSVLNLTLYNYSGSSSHIGMSMDAKANPGIWYIGSDAFPHLYSGDRTGNWAQSPSQDEAKWPLADSADAELAVTSDADNDRIWLFYVVDGNVTMLVSTGGSWDDPVALIPYNSTTEAAGMVRNTTSSSSGGLSSSSKIGIGVGVGVGVPLIMAALTLYVCIRIKRSRQARAQQQQPVANVTPSTATSSQAPQPTISDTPLSQYKPGLDNGQNGYWVDGMWVPLDHSGVSPYRSENKPPIAQVVMVQGVTANAYTGFPMVESDSAQVYEMAHDEHAHEMPVTRDTVVLASYRMQDEGISGDGFILSSEERPRVGRVVEQL